MGTTQAENVNRPKKVFVSMQQMAMFINSKLHAYPFKLHREVIMEKLMGSTLVKLHLLH
jgi:hypothetical protein